MLWEKSHWDYFINHGSVTAASEPGPIGNSDMRCQRMMLLTNNKINFTVWKIIFIESIQIITTLIEKSILDLASSFEGKS